MKVTRTLAGALALAWARLADVRALFRGEALVEANENAGRRHCAEGEASPVVIVKDGHQSAELQQNAELQYSIALKNPHH